MPHQVTVTAKTGPDRTATGTLLANVNEVHFNFDDRRLYVYQSNVMSGGMGAEFELSNAAVVTFVNNNGNFSITIA